MWPFRPPVLDAKSVTTWDPKQGVFSVSFRDMEGNEIDGEAFTHVGELRALIEVPFGEEVAVAVSPVAAVVQLSVAAPVQAAPAVRTDGVLDYYELARSRDISLKDLRHEIEMQCIKRALEEASGNISEAARLLKMKRSRLSQIVNGELELKEVTNADE